jgi:hypothetical protein
MGEHRIKKRKRKKDNCRVSPCLGTEKTPDFQTPLLHRRRAVTHRPPATSSHPGPLHLSRSLSLRSPSLSVSLWLGLDLRSIHLSRHLFLSAGTNRYKKEERKGRGEKGREKTKKKKKKV